MKYTIIEDCSPYYIRFTWDGLDELIKFIKNQPIENGNILTFKGYTHINFDFETANAIINQLPMSNDFDFMKTRVALFATHPHKKSSVHKDGADHRFSINKPIEIHDTNCTTHWWTDESLQEFEQANSVYSRTIGFKENLPLPIKTMIAVPNECILFNTDIYHDWDNTKSSNQRTVLTLRVNDPGATYFDDAKKIIFEI